MQYHRTARRDPVHEYVIGRARRTFDLFGYTAAVLLVFMMFWAVLVVYS